MGSAGGEFFAEDAAQGVFDFWVRAFEVGANNHRDLPLKLLPLAQFGAKLDYGDGGIFLKPASW